MRSMLDLAVSLLFQLVFSQAKMDLITSIAATSPPSLGPTPPIVVRRDPAPAKTSSTSKLWYLAHDCVPYSDPDFNGNNVCQCDNGVVYPQNPTSGVPPKSWNACYATASPTKTTAIQAGQCEVFGPSDCPAAKETINIEQVIEEAEKKYADDYHRWMFENCTDLQYHYGYPGPEADDQGDTCQKVIPIGDHMKWWWTKNKAACEAHDVKFADCFFDTVPSPKYPATNCARLGGNDYCPEPDYKRFGGPNATVDFYVAWNIYNFAIWCNTYYQAIYTSGFLSGQQVWNMTDTFINPVKGIPEWATILLYVLTFAFGFISPSGWGKLTGKKVGTGGTPEGLVNQAEQRGNDWIASFQHNLGSFFQKTYQAPWEYVLRGVQQLPTFLLHKLPSATDDGVDALMSAGDVEAQLGFFVDTIATVMENVASSVPGNVTALDEWTKPGYFYSPSADQQSMTDTIKSALNMFVLAQMLLNGEFIIVRQLDTNPHTLYAEGNNGSHGDLSSGFIDCPGYDQWGMCNYWWYDSADNIAYGLMQPDYKHQHQNYTDSVQTIFELGLTTPEDLYLSSQICALTSESPQGPKPGLGTANSPGSFMSPCLSNIPICTWNLEGKWPEFQEKGCEEFQTSSYDLPDCKADNPDPPAAYLGYWLYHGIEATCSD